MNQAEHLRLEALRDLNLLDTPPSESFDRISRMASQLFGVPIAAVSLTDQDRQWFKSRVGVDHWQIPREKAPCAQVATSADVLVVPDLLRHDCFRNSLLADAGVRFYAGAPLVTRDGYGLGAMCVLGTEPREVTEQEVRALQDLAAMVMAQIELQHAFGRVDPVSGLPTRNQFLDDLEDTARDHPGELRSAVLIDMADVNELAEALRVVGPSYIDDLVKAATRSLRAAVPAGTNIYQIANTQYAFLVDSMDEGSLARRARLFDLRLRRTARSQNLPLMMAPSIGIAPFRLGELAPRDVLRAAHSAAQEARQAEIAYSVYSPGMDAHHRRRFTILADIRTAVAEDQLRLVYQPRVDVTSGICVGAEALLRWRHPTLGEIPPGEFIPLVEQTTLVREVTDWVLRAATAQTAAWRRAGIDLTVSVNVSAANLDEDGFADALLELLRQHGLPPSSIELELTESALIRNGRRALEQLEGISAAGVPVAIDDFGTGYSSLAYLQQIPAGILKIDRSFMAEVDQGGHAATLVRAMIVMAHDLGYRVVAEGVETAAALTFLAENGCEEAQGYFISRPVSPADLELWLERNGASASEPHRLSA
jgi:EAL domain-containing protein (putative c-di-GMP-specific phosphodiesterase class I)/GAF domain-containing protein